MGKKEAVHICPNCHKEVKDGTTHVIYPGIVGSGDYICTSVSLTEEKKNKSY